MSIPLLVTKFHIPRLRPELVSRPRLVAALDAGLARRLTLLSAPAGYGKTTLLSEWIFQRGFLTSDSGLAPPNPALDHHPPISKIENPKFAWLSLDPADNDPVRFLAHLFAALQQVEPGLGVEASQALQSPQLPSQEELLTGLINQASALPAPLVLILDDYHLIEAAFVHSLITFLLDHLPARMHLVIASRADPPLPLARLRASGQLVELRLGDLRFTLPETAGFLGRVVGPQLDAQAAQTLTARTEGWAAGLQMAAVSLQGRDAGRQARFIASFTGSSHFVLDYLAEEVLQRQPPHIQAFLRRTSILERLSGPLCDALLKDEPAAPQLPAPPAPSAALLDQLEHANLFLIPLDDEQRWYRYHQLFADLLQSRLLQTEPALAPVLRQRASAWHEQNGMLAEAIGYALAAQDYERAVRLIEQAAEATLMRSEMATFLGWMEKLPDQAVRSRPTLCVYHAWALLVNGYPQEAIEARLKSAEGEAGLGGGTAAPLRAFIALYQGQPAQAAELARQALAQLPEGEAFWRSLATLTLGSAYLSDGLIAAAQQTLDEAARLSQKTGNILVAVIVGCHLAELCRKEGQLRQAHTLYRQALERATGEGGRRWPIAGRALIGLGEIEREWNHLEAATQYLADGIELSLQWGQLGALSGYAALTRVRQAQGQAQAAREVLEAAQQVLAKSEASEMNVIGLNMIWAWLWVTQGDLAAAERWAEQRGLNTAVDAAELEASHDYIKYHLRKYEYPILARLRLAEGRPAEALAFLEPALPRVEKWQRPALVIEMYILKALALHALGQPEMARQALARALALAAPEGYMRIFVDEGERLRWLVSDFRVWIEKTHPDLKSYLETLSAAFAQADSPEPRPAGQSKILEPLSDRELEVLRLLDTALSAAEIAAELSVAVSTVRSHTKNIYGKLGVNSRLEALQRARELELIT